MFRRGGLHAFAVLFFGAGFASGAFAADSDTEAGRRAEIREEWIGAVRAYEKALAAAPDDEMRQRRLAVARKRGARLWAEEAEACADVKDWRRAAQAVAAFRILNPTSKRLDRVAKKIEAKGSSIPKLGRELAAAVDALPRRSFEGRVAAMSRLGSAGARANRTIESLLTFLVLSQREDGTWDLDKYGGMKRLAVGIDALGLLALTAEGPVHLAGSRGRAMSRTADRLLKAQDPEGCFGPRSSPHFTYAHAVAARALVEYALISGKVEEYRPAITKALAFTLKAQSTSGGWRYGVAPPDSDSSVTYWFVAALERFHDAGRPVDNRVWVAAHRYAVSVTDPKHGRGGYTTAGTGPARQAGDLEKFPADRSESLSGAVIMIREMTIRACPDLAKAATADEALTMKLIRECLPDAVIPDMYYWHLGAEAMTRVSGSVAPPWYESCLNSVVQHMRRDGSVGANDPWARDGGRIYSTAICALALTAPFAEFRPLPVVRRDRRTIVLLVRPGGGPTGLYLDAGQEVVVEPKDMATSHADIGPCGPEGMKKAPKGRERLSRSGTYGCLLGWIGPEGKPKALKKKMKFRAPECGQLYLAANEADPSCGGGAFTVTIRMMGEGD